MASSKERRGILRRSPCRGGTHEDRPAPSAIQERFIEFKDCSQFQKQFRAITMGDFEVAYL